MKKHSLPCRTPVRYCRIWPNKTEVIPHYSEIGTPSSLSLPITPSCPPTRSSSCPMENGKRIRPVLRSFLASQTANMASSNEHTLLFDLSAIPLQPRAKSLHCYQPRSNRTLRNDAAVDLRGIMRTEPCDPCPVTKWPCLSHCRNGGENP